LRSHSNGTLVSSQLELVPEEPTLALNRRRLRQPTNFSGWIERAS